MVLLYVCVSSDVVVTTTSWISSITEVFALHEAAEADARSVFVFNEESRSNHAKWAITRNNMIEKSPPIKVVDVLSETKFELFFHKVFEV